MEWQLVAVSLSPQSLASLGAHFNLPIPAVYRKLNTFFRQYLRVDFVFDTSFARDFALLEQAAEFVARYRQQHKLQPAAEAGSLPMLASSCPGWVCFAEKKHGSYILPYISSTKSPQQISGSLVKTILPKILQAQSGDHAAPQVEPAKILHVSVMPCYDKKLEASREDFYSDLLQSHDVDLVLTTTEVEQLLQRYSVNFPTLAETSPAPLYDLLVLVYIHLSRS